MRERKKSVHASTSVLRKRERVCVCEGWNKVRVSVCVCVNARSARKRVQRPESTSLFPHRQRGKHQQQEEQEEQQQQKPEQLKVHLQHFFASEGPSPTLFSAQPPSPLVVDGGEGASGQLVDSLCKLT